MAGCRALNNMTPDNNVLDDIFSSGIKRYQNNKRDEKQLNKSEVKRSLESKFKQASYKENLILMSDSKYDCSHYDDDFDEDTNS